MSATLDRLKTVMKDRGLSQSDLAREAGLDASTINKLMSGSRSPGRRVAVAIERVCGIPVADWDDVPSADHDESANGTRGES
jgi:transcriptional regulator with XRE-family HTH domain